MWPNQSYPAQGRENTALSFVRCRSEYDAMENQPKNCCAVRSGSSGWMSNEFSFRIISVLQPYFFFPTIALNTRRCRYKAGATYFRQTTLDQNPTGMCYLIKTI
jgi:hypothetical protein